MLKDSLLSKSAKKRATSKGIDSLLKSSVPIAPVRDSDDAVSSRTILKQTGGFSARLPEPKLVATAALGVTLPIVKQVNSESEI